MSKRERLRRAKKKDSVYPTGDGEKEIKKARSSDKKRGPRWDSNPRGYEREIGPEQERTGKHEPSSCACDRGHKSYKHQDMGNMQHARRRNTEIRDNAQRHGCDSESERRSRRVTDVNNGQSKEQEQAKGEREQREHRGEARGKGIFGQHCV